jgi:ATP:ADP antiporter, AAA family
LSKQKILSHYQKFRESRLRHTIWPIRSSELFKFTPTAMLMFTILLNQNMVRSLKDSLVMTHIGAEIINFIKLWGEVPFGILFVIIYSKLCDKASPEKAFRVVIYFFMAFFATFAFVLYPNSQLLQPDPNIIKGYIQLYPHAKWFILMWGKWIYVLMYIFGELWTVIVFTLLFWQLANKITKIEEASRFYPFFTIFGQANCLIAGSLIIYFSSKSHFIRPLFEHLNDSTEIMIKSMITVVLATGTVCVLLQKYIDKKIIIPAGQINTKINRKEKLKLGLIDSFKLVAKSKYLICIVLILISYSFSINLIEGIWMSKAREMYPKPEQFIKYHGQVLFWTGVVTITCAIIGSKMIIKFSWKSAAILTPIVMLVTGAAFFSGVIWQKHLSDIIIFGKEFSILAVVILLGSIQHIFSKGFKYSLYDATKEMAYIPLSEDKKTKGKAAADIVGVKIGKSSGAIIQIIIFTIFPQMKYEDAAPFLMSVFVIICVGWILSVSSLAKKYNAKIASLNK